eukprot:2598278-Amphidinium_carterae.1
MAYTVTRERDSYHEPRHEELVQSLPTPIIPTPVPAPARALVPLSAAMSAAQTPLSRQSTRLTSCAHRSTKSSPNGTVKDKSPTTEPLNPLTGLSMSYAITVTEWILPQLLPCFLKGMPSPASVPTQFSISTPLHPQGSMSRGIQSSS